VVDRSVDLGNVRPVFRTLRKSSSVFIKDRKQDSGQSAVDLSETVFYRIDVPGAGSKLWSVKVRRR
jgi:hypothetical protein